MLFELDKEVLAIKKAAQEFAKNEVLPRVNED